RDTHTSPHPTIRAAPQSSPPWATLAAHRWAWRGGGAFVGMIAGMGETVSASPFLETDVPCAQCGYNLRTLRAVGRCPECGSDVGPSIWIHRRKQQRRPQPPELLSA